MIHVILYRYTPYHILYRSIVRSKHISATMFFKSKFGSAVASPKRVLGASVDDVSKALLGGETFLKYEEYNSFWSTLSAERDVCSRYVARIINLLMNYEADPIKIEKQLQKTSLVNIEYFIVNLINTLQFLDMFVGIDPTNGAFVSSIEKYEAKKRINPRFKVKRVDEALHELSRRRDHRGHVAVKFVVDCASLESDAELQRAMQKSMSEMMFLDESGFDNIIDSTRSDYPFVFICLSRIARTESAAVVFDEMLRQLNGGTGCTLSALPHMQGRTLAIILMLKELLTQNPTNDDAWMQRATSIVGSFYKWPKPYGPFARELIEFIDIERRVPGWHLRERLMSEFPQLRPQRIALGESTTISWSGGLGCTFVFLDGSLEMSRAYTETFSMGSLSHDTAGQQLTAVAATELKRKILTHIIELDFSIRKVGSEVDNNDPLGLISRSEDQISGWYDIAISICAQARHLPCEYDSASTDCKDPRHLPPGGIAKLFREAHFSELIDEIAPSISYVARRAPLFDKSAVPSASMRKSTTFLPGPPGSPQSCPSPIRVSPHCPPPEDRERSIAALEISGDDEEILEGDDDSNPNLEIPEPVLSFGEYSPVVPPLHFSAFEFAPDILTAPNASKRISMPLNSRDMKYQYDQLDVDALRQLITASKLQEQDSDSNVLLKVLLIGGNFVVNISLELFIAPVLRNDIATFLARSDKWYRRHVYYPFVGPIGICPQFDFKHDANSVISASNPSSSIPIKCMQSLLENFVRQAKHTVDACVFECLCWTEYSSVKSSRADGQADGPATCIPFITSLDIGVFVQAHIFRTRMAQAAAEASKNVGDREICAKVPSYDDEYTSLKEAFYSKNFSPVSTELSISYAPSTMTGDVEEESILKTGQYMTVSLNNLPDMYDDFGLPLRKNKSEFSVPSLPDSGVLLMSSRSNRNNLMELLSNRKKNIKGKSDWFLDAIVQPEAFDVPVNVSIVDIVAANPLESFNVLIDGRIFGPFKRIVVRPCQVLNGEDSTTPSTLPIKSFLPVAP